jgi:hypothetical protein
MEEFVDILSRDINNWQRMLAKYKPVKVSVAATIDNKQRPLFLPDRALKSSIGDLLSSYFASTPHKVFLCLACLPEDENPEGSQSPAPEPPKPAAPAKTKRGPGRPRKIKPEPPAATPVCTVL